MKTLFWMMLFLAAPAAACAATALPEKGVWSVTGTFLDACQCDVFCACEFAEKPTYGHCDDTAVLTIERGVYGGVRLDGRTVVVVSQSPRGERLVDTVGDLVFARLYVSEETSDLEAQALAELARRVFGTWVGGKVARISPDEKVAKVRLAAAADAQRHRVSIPGVLEIDVEALTGWDGKNPVLLRNGPASAPGMSDITIARSRTYRYTDHGVDWNYAGRSASVRTLDLAGAIEHVPAEPAPAPAPAGGGHGHHH